MSEKDLENFKQLESSQKDQKVISKDKNQEQLSYNENKKRKSDINKLKNSIGKIEKKIEQLEIVLKQKDTELSDPDKFKELSSDSNFFDVYKQEQNSLKDLEKKWADQTEELEGIL